MQIHPDPIFKRDRERDEEQNGTHLFPGYILWQCYRVVSPVHGAITSPRNALPFARQMGSKHSHFRGARVYVLRESPAIEKKKGTFKVFFSAQGAIFVEEKMGLDDFTNPVCEGFMGTIDSKLGEDKDGLKLPQPGLKPGGGFMFWYFAPTWGK